MNYPAYPGNVTPAPAYVSNGYTTDPELLISANNYEQKGVTLKPGQGVLKIGTFLAYDAGSKQYIKTTTAADVKGVLRQTVDTGTDANGQVWLANILYRGTLNYSLVSAANPSGVVFTNVLNAIVDTVTNSFRI